MESAALTVSRPHPAFQALLSQAPLAEIAAQFVAAQQHALFDGWPRGTVYVHALHSGRLARVTPFLPVRLLTLRRGKQWFYLTEAVNALRDRRSATYRTQVEIDHDCEDL